MNEFRDAKEAYDNTPVPPELPERVEAGIQKGEALYRSRRKQTARRWIAAAACFCLVLAGLNLSPTLARAAANVPVLGRLFQVLTLVDYDKSEDGIHYDVSAPKVDAESDLAEKVNAAIQEKVDQHLAKAQQDWNDYRDAFFATGGTCEYYNLDFTENRDLTLRDFLGEDWITLCNAAIQKQIDESVDEDGFTYFFAPDEGGFTTVDESTDFYVREDGAVVVCYPRYSIAAGAAGNLEFVIQP